MAVIFLGNYRLNSTTIVLRFYKTDGIWEIGNQDFFGNWDDFVIHRDGGLPDVVYDAGGNGFTFSTFGEPVATPQDVLELEISVTPTIGALNTGTVVFPAGMFGDLGPTNLTPASDSNGAANALYAADVLPGGDTTPAPTTPAPTTAAPTTAAPAQYVSWAGAVPPQVEPRIVLGESVNPDSFHPDRWE